MPRKTIVVITHISSYSNGKVQMVLLLNKLRYHFTATLSSIKDVILLSRPSYRSDGRGALDCHIKAETKWPLLPSTHFQMHFYWNLTEIHSWAFNWYYTSTDSDNGLAPIRRQSLSEPVMINFSLHICITWPKWVIYTWARGVSHIDDQQTD